VEPRIGSHEVTRKGDVFIVRLRGAFSLSDAQDYVQLRNAIQAELRYVLLVFDTTHATTLPPEARRFIVNAKVQGDPHLHGIAFLGVRPFVRAMIQLLFSAVTLIGQRPVYTYFASTEDDAHHYLHEQRQRIVRRIHATNESEAK
jgi:hypothetical protein